jgi:shikimate kinase
MLIFVTGYMGAGKTAFGKRLAEKLNCRFYDLDDIIVQTTGISIENNFEKFGEDSFREKERDILLKHLQDTDTVIATGGGTACYANNMKLMNRHGITIFLDTPLEIILIRLSAEYHHRPLLKDIPPDRLSGFIRAHYESRLKYYTLAKIRIDGEILDLDEIISNLL